MYDPLRCSSKLVGRFSVRILFVEVLRSLLSMKKSISVILLIMAISDAYSQVILRDADTLSQQKRLTIVNINRDQSYLAFGSGFGNLEPLIFEAKFSPGFLVTARNRPWVLMFNPQIQVRMLNRRSVPIRHPSYRGNLTFYRAIDRKWPTIYEDALWFAAVGHHSNGQEGDFYEDDSTQRINLDQGNFSTNFIQLGLASYSLRPAKGNSFSAREIKVHAEVHLSFLRPHARKLNEQYGLYRSFVTYRAIGFGSMFKRKGLKVWAQQSGVAVQVGWIFGDLYQARSREVSKRFILDINYQFYPRWLDKFAFFVRYYRGQDYYNLQFVRTLSNVSFGITSNITKPGRAVKYFNPKK